MHTVLVLQLDRTVTAHFPDGPTGLPCYRLLNRVEPCAECPLEHLTEAHPQTSVIRRDAEQATHHHLRLVPPTQDRPAQVIETLMPVTDTALLAPQDLLTHLLPLYHYAVEQHRPLSLLLLKYRKLTDDVSVSDLKARFPRRFRSGGIVGELPGRQLVWISPHLSEDAFARLAVRIRKDFPDPFAYTLHAFHAVPPTPADSSLTGTACTFLDWVTHQSQVKTIPPPSFTLTPPTEPTPSQHQPTRPIPGPREMSPQRRLPPLHNPVTQLEAILTHLETAGPALRQAVDRVRSLREHQADAEALLFAELLQPLHHAPSLNGIAETATIRDAVQLMDVFAKESGRLLLELYERGTLAHHGYRTIGEFATAIGLHPETAATLIQLAIHRRPLIQTGYPHRVPSRAKPRPVGLILQQDRRQLDRRQSQKPVNPQQDRRSQPDRRQSSYAQRSTEPPTHSATAS